MSEIKKRKYLNFDENVWTWNFSWSTLVNVCSITVDFALQTRRNQTDVDHSISQVLKYATVCFFIIFLLFHDQIRRVNDFKKPRFIVNSLLTF